MKTFSEMKYSFLPEASKVKPLLGKTKDELIKLKYNKFPDENDPELKVLSYKDRSTIMYAKDAVFAASHEKIGKDKSKDGRAQFKSSGAKVGDYTTLGLVTRVKRNSVIFNDTNDVLFDAKLINGKSAFIGITKINKDQYEKQEKQRKAAHADMMQAHVDRTPRSTN